MLCDKEGSMNYKCYIATIEDNQYYFYFNNSSQVYSNIVSVIKPAESIEQLDKVASTVLLSITDIKAHLKFKKTVDIYCTREPSYDLNI